MMQALSDDLWRDFLKTATEFEARFATEADCHVYWIATRWGGKPSCARCDATQVWPIREGTTFERADCGRQTSLTSGTLLEKTARAARTRSSCWWPRRQTEGCASLTSRTMTRTPSSALPTAKLRPTRRS